MFGLRGEHFVLTLGIAAVLFAAYQAASARPFDAFLWAGVALVGFGLFRRQLRRVKAGPSGIELAVEHTIGVGQTLDASPKVEGMADAEAAANSTATKEVREQLRNDSQPEDLKLLISSGIPVGAAELVMGTDHIVQATVINTSDRPIGINSIGLELADRHWIPGIDALPSDDNVRLPAILKPQEQATVWWDHDSLRDLLRQERTEIAALVANLRDDTKRRRAVPDDWRRLT